MTMHTIFALVAVGLCGAFALSLPWTARAPEERVPRRGWMLAALASVAFSAFTLWAILAEGPTGFWPEHVRHLWGNQIFFDLLCCASVGLLFAVPRARDAGMKPLPWIIFTLATGSIGFLAMAARILYLESKRARR